MLRDLSRACKQSVKGVKKLCERCQEKVALVVLGEKGSHPRLVQQRTLVAVRITREGTMKEMAQYIRATENSEETWQTSG